MSAHTPSPWHTEGVFLPGTPDAHVTVWSAPQPGFQSGDEVAKYVHPRDARLIASAPELLAALKAANARLLARMHTDSADDYNAYSAACAAIAKATRSES